MYTSQINCVALFLIYFIVVFLKILTVSSDNNYFILSLSS